MNPALRYAALAAALSCALPEAAASTLSLTVVEVTGGEERPLPCRVHLANAAGEPQKAAGVPFYRDHFVMTGDAEIELAPGAYSYTIERGPEYRRRSGSLEMAQEPVEKKIVLERSIDLAARGWFSGETHVHRAVEEMPLHLRAEDLHVAPVLTVWNQRNHWSERALPDDLIVHVEPTRAYHVLACEDERGGGALLYFHLRTPLELTGDRREFPSPVTHLRTAIAQSGAWPEVEKPFWWDVPTWVASGHIRSVGLANNHMCRSQMYENEAWGRPRDEERLPPPRGNGLYTQELYYRFLDCGFRLPPSAGSASGVLPNPVGYNRVYVHLDEPFSWDGWWQGLAAGRSFVTNGPLLLVEANGRRPGEVFRAARALRLALDVRVEGNDPLESIEVVRNGEVVQTIQGEGARGRWLRPHALEFTESGWFLVRAIARVPETFRFASTAPFYVEVAGARERVDPEDAAFFLQWIDERIARLRQAAVEDFGTDERRREVIAPHLEARAVYEQLLRRATEATK